MLAHVPSFGRNPRGSPDFLAYPVPKACMHVPGTRVPRRLGVARSASSPKAALVRVEACIFGAFDCHYWSTQSLETASSLLLYLEVFGSPVFGDHDGTSLDGLDVQVFGLDVQELSTHPGAEQRKGNQSSYPV